jgi:hypothetical protein
MNKSLVSKCLVKTELNLYKAFGEALYNLTGYYKSHNLIVSQSNYLIITIHVRNSRIY